MILKFHRDGINEGLWFTSIDVRWHSAEYAIEVLKNYLLGYYTRYNANPD